LHFYSTTENGKKKWEVGEEEDLRLRGVEFRGNQEN